MTICDRREEGGYTVGGWIRLCRPVTLILSQLTISRDMGRPIYHLWPPCPQHSYRERDERDYVKEIIMGNNDIMYAFGMLANAMGGGGDEGQGFPRSDAEDFSNGARYIPGEVTLARREGKKIVFNPENHTWTMPDGSTIG